MFIVELNYKVSLQVIDKYVDEHRKYLDRYFALSVFISSGPKVPRVGGVILAHLETKTELVNIIKEDPFYKNNLADYSIIEFNPTKGIF